MRNPVAQPVRRSILRGRQAGRLPLCVQLLDQSVVAGGLRQFAFVHGARCEAEAVGEERDGQLRVVTGAVVALPVVLHRQLPVPGLDQVKLQRDPAVPDGVREQVGLHGSRHVLDIGRRSVRQADEQQPGYRAQGDGLEAEAGGVELLAHVVGVEQPAVQSVGPGVVAANQVADLTLAIRRQLRAAVTADVVEGAHHTVIVAQDQHGRLADVQGHHVAGLRHIRLLTDEDPVAGEDQLQIGTVDRLVRVEGPLQAMARRASQQQGWKCVWHSRLPHRHRATMRCRAGWR